MKSKDWISAQDCGHTLCIKCIKMAQFSTQAKEAEHTTKGQELLSFKKGSSLQTYCKNAL